MPSESVAGFLEHAAASRVLFPEQVEQLIRQPDIPQSNLACLCEYLLARGVLTRFQADAIRERRGGDLNYAGYPLVDDLGPCPGGRAYRALHPSLRTPLLLRRLRGDWLAPADSPEAYVARARSVGMIAHPNLVHLLDVGIQGGEVYVVLDPPADAADVETLTREIGGAMPAFLAAEYGRALASVLRAVHERGGFHGDVRPCHVWVAPLTVKTSADGRTRRRPAPDAVVRLAELGLVPVRPPAADWPTPTEAVPYLPPERLDQADSYTPAADIYALGATLYFLLAGRAPFEGPDRSELFARVRAAEPVSIAALRPDLPADLATLVMRMLAKHPGQRPVTAAAVEQALSPFCRPGTVPPLPTVVPLASPTLSPLSQPVPLAVAATAAEARIPEPVEPNSAAPFADWGVSPPQPTPADARPTPRYREMTTAEKRRSRLLFILGGLMHLTAIALLILWLAGVFDRKRAPVHTGPDTKPARLPGRGGDDRPKPRPPSG